MSALRNNRMLVLGITLLILAVAFAAACILVLLYKKDEPWLLVVLIVAGIAGLLNAAYLQKLRRKPIARRRPGTSSKR